MSIMDVLTGGKSKEAADALKRAEAAYASIPVPNAAQLTLPELQKYVQAGILTPAQAEAAQVVGNAYNDIKVDPSSREAQSTALGQLEEVAKAKGLTPQMQAQLTEALDKVATNTHGTNASILDQMAQKGVPTSLLAPAAMESAAGDEARTANLTSTAAAGQAEQNALNAIMNSGNLATQIHGQDYSEAARKAEAENALREWNAGAKNTANLTNAGFTQEANRMNTENKQNVSNANTETTNKRTAYNATVPETVFNNQITKAAGQAGVNRSQAEQATNEGNQEMGLIGAGVGAAANAFAPGSGSIAKAKAPAGYNPNITEDQLPGYDVGGKVPGTAMVSGDSPKNDTVHARLSPGEIVVPRSIAPHPDAVKNFVTHLIKNKPVKPVHPHDVHAVLEALSMRRP